MTTNNPTKKKSSSLVLRPLNPQDVQLRPASDMEQSTCMDHYRNSFFGFVYAVFARIDEVVLATGELQPLGAERPVKAPFAGVIQEILVKEGQKVNYGDTLLRFDPEVSRKRKETLETQIARAEKI